MVIELITVGSELLAGQTLNTNALFIGEQMGIAGLSLSRQTSIPDEAEVIAAALKESLDRAEWILVSGGLGPTNDDVTKVAISRALGLPIVQHPEILHELIGRYTKAKRPATPFLESQAEVPESAEIIPNQLGSAVGFYLKHGRSTVAVVPGVPREMRPMIREHIVPRIAREAKTSTRTTIWSSTGVPESRLYELLLPAMETHPGVDVGFLPSEHGVRLKFTARGADATAILDSWSSHIRPILGTAVFAEVDTSLEAVVGSMLKDRGLTLAVAESCTGGLVAKRFTDVPGASAYMLAGLVTYANEAKSEFLDVDPVLIQHHGAVSGEVARAMVKGAATVTGADCAIAVTGIAGPDGGTEEKPVGTVWIATLVHEVLHDRRLQFMGDREMIRERAAQAAMNALRLHLLGVAL